MRPRLVLASASPRRSEILRQLGILHEVRAPGVEETVQPGEAPAVAARRLAEEKARAVVASAGEWVLAADTIVALGDDALGKPSSREEAVEMLVRLSGRRHEVFTGLALLHASHLASGVARTSVRFRSVARSECEEYVATGEPLDKAGAYGIQGRGAALVDHIDGDFFNVVGLPVRLLLSLFERHGLRYDFAGLSGPDPRSGAVPERDPSPGDREPPR